VDQISGADWIVLAVLSVVWAIFGYRLSERDRRLLGRTPWGLPSALWAFLWFLSLILGLVLYLIAHAGGVRRAQQNFPFGAAGGGGLSAPPGPPPAAGHPLSVADQFPTYPNSGNLQPSPPDLVESTTEPPSPEAQVQAPAPAPADWAQSPPGWHPDPSGRFHYRWWDGHQWTTHVSLDGHHLVDTNPDQRIGPY
jgi:Protein of unknown function (DUF2510)